MVFSDFHFYSQTLGIQTAAYVLLPDPQIMAQSDEPVPVLYLLHGLSDDHTMWLRNTRIEQYARSYRIAVVMPAANRSFYMDMAHGAKYDTFIAEELPAIVERYFPVSHARKGRFAAGLSMGGYGALKLGLTRSNRYAAVASISGALEMEKSFDPLANRDKAFLREVTDIYGSEGALKNGSGNLALSAEKLCQTPGAAPRMYIACGTEDSLLSANESFVSRFGARLPIEYHTEQGAHTWDFWDKHIKAVLEWLPLEKAENVW